jgi:hypothetical protein
MVQRNHTPNCMYVNTSAVKDGGSCVRKRDRTLVSATGYGVVVPHMYRTVCTQHRHRVSISNPNVKFHWSTPYSFVCVVFVLWFVLSILDRGLLLL